ncbi:MAG: thioredoxin family protein [Phycisphaerae bacterium]
MSAQSASSEAFESAPAPKKKSRFWQIFWLAFLVASLWYAWYSFYVPPNSIAWADTFPAAAQQAADAGRPMILFFTAKWCVPCKIMKRQVWADQQVTVAVNGHFIPVTIDVDNPENAALLERYNVGSTPLTIVTDPHGNALQWRVGGIGKREFLKLLKTSNSPQSNPS